MTSLLATYEAKAKTMDTHCLLFALGDIRETLDIHRDKPMDDPYHQKLWAEWDAYVVEVQKRRGA